MRREKGGGRDGRPAGDRGDEFNPKRQITRSTLHCLSLELTLQSPTHTGSESVTHYCPSDAQTHTHTHTHTHRIAKTYYHGGDYYKAHNHYEVREAALWAWSETERLKEGFLSWLGVLLPLVSEDTDDLRLLLLIAPWSSEANLLESKHDEAPNI